MIQIKGNRDNHSPLVSIVTIVYNGAEYLNDCIQSVRAQTYKNIEYIIIDGGSTDGSLEICAQNDDLISKLVSEKDNGISDAFNKGIKHATGDIIGILNSDDSYRPNAIEFVVDAYLKGGKNECILYGDICYFNDEVNYELIPDLKPIWKFMSIFHPAVFVTKSAYDRIGLFSEAFKYAMDVEFIHRALFKQVEFVYIARTLTNFRLGGTSAVNYRGSYREFYKSVKMYNDHPLAKYYYYLGITKKFILSSRIGTFLRKNRSSLSIFLSGKDKPSVQ
ncbi:glycosyltransferase family 2 protein [Arcticibacter sp.]|uniref:glycosyltransferase family 2 protein n=1 Tax=Arcticibacter sp. TaxID=1872630 RepID=UPI00388F4EF1